MTPRPESKDNNISQLILQISFSWHRIFKSKTQAFKTKILFICILQLTILYLTLGKRTITQKNKTPENNN